MSYPPIGDYALLADCHSSALVSGAGSVDWACLLRFDAASVFGRILDWERGGHFAVTPVGAVRSGRRYRGESLVLETTVETETGVARIVDAFAMREGGGEHPSNELLRVIEGVEGAVEVDVVVEPRFDYGELRPWLRYHGDTGAWSAVGGDSALVISAPWPLTLLFRESRFFCRGTVRAGERAGFVVGAQVPHLLDPRPVPQEEILAKLDTTQQWWDSWSAHTRAEGPWAQAVRRSAVVLKGLTCAPTGAIIAAPTTSLPEEIGGERNWDYRFSWIRDSTLALAALAVTGHPEVARAFRDFIMRSAGGSPADLQIMYGIDGRRHLPEYIVRLSGYRGSAPVRVGNAAADQVQLDMYGHVLDAAFLWRKVVTDDPTTPDVIELARGEWDFLRELVDEAIARWPEPDRGIWEIRGEPRHFVTSKVMLWVAVDRGIRIAEEGHLDEPNLPRWRRERDAMRAEIDDRGVADGHYVQSYGSTEVDGALLLLPIVGYCSASDGVMRRTVEVIRRDLAVPPQGFIRRYRTEVAAADDGVPGHEATFLLCSFWLVEILSLQEDVDQATDLFERLLACANDLGLLAEEYDPASGELLGNFPQAFSHMALINAAHQLNRAAAGRGEAEAASSAERMIERW